MNRILALDIGSVRIGAAISDSLGIIAQGLGVWKTENDEWLQDFDECLEKYNPSKIIIGLPVRTDGKKSEACENILKVADMLKAKYPERNFITWDERFTTVIAQHTLIEAGISRKNRKKSVDKIAAVLILESWLEFNRSSYCRL